MGWDIEVSRERLKKEWERLQGAGVTVSKLTREMDLANLSPTEVRTVHGCHLYCHAVNFVDALDDALLSRDKFQETSSLPACASRRTAQDHAIGI